MSIVLFDGVCNLCNGAVRFIVKRDPRARFHFASLQSEAGKRLLAEHDRKGDPLSSIVLIQGGRAYLRSSAALRIALGLTGLWPMLGIFLAIPPFIRDAVYDFVALRRYRWFGTREYCEIPTPQDRKRFL